ncbi:hypothetical protein HGRIS_001668 [Hohenbuehelia grisea]|uniref:Uncharacterized protein n=1 Tax=Hohenbuehelia grisea TaxID=104357 RepID=A0ABR3JI98_9AGAR
MVRTSSTLIVVIVAINSAFALATPLTANPLFNDPIKASDLVANDNSLEARAPSGAGERLEARRTAPAPSTWQTNAKSVGKTFGPAVLGAILGPAITKLLNQRDLEELEERANWKSIAQNWGPLGLGVGAPVIDKVLNGRELSSGHELEGRAMNAAAWKSIGKTFGPAVAGAVLGPVVTKLLSRRELEELEARANWKSIAQNWGPLALGLGAPLIDKILHGRELDSDDFNIVARSLDADSEIEARAANWKTIGKTFGPAAAGAVIGPIVSKLLNGRDADSMQWDTIREALVTRDLKDMMLEL